MQSVEAVCEKQYNGSVYHQGYQQIQQQESKHVVGEGKQLIPKLKMTRRMMQSLKLLSIEDAAMDWIKHRLKLIYDLEMMILELNERQKDWSIRKVGGAKTSLIGATMLVGGIIGAPLTLGSSLVVSSAGLGCMGLGTGATFIASIKEWKHAKKSAKVIQEMLKKDTEIVNDMIKRIFDHKKTQPDIEYYSIMMGEHIVNVSTFLEAFLTHKYPEFSNATNFKQDLKETCSLATMIMKGVIPILSVPIDLVILVEETKKSNGSEPATLVKKLIPILESLKIQTEEATGVPMYFRYEAEEEEELSETVSNDE